MTEVKNLYDFFENPVTSEIMENNKVISEIAAARIMSIADMLDIEDGENLDRDIMKELSNALREESRNLLRNASMGTVLTDSSENEAIVNVDAMVDNIADGCKKVFGDKIAVIVTEHTKTHVKINEKMLKFCIIGFIRRLCIAAGSDNFEIHIGSSKAAGKVKIFVYSNIELPEEEEKIPVSDNKKSRNINYYDKNYDSIRKLFNDKLNLQMNGDPSSLEIVLSEVEVNDNSKEIEFKSPLVSMNKADFSDYFIMLTDAYDE